MASYPNGYTKKYGGGDKKLDEIIKKQSEKYAAAKAAGDVKGMRDANDAANMARNEYGYAAEYANADIEDVKRKTGYYKSSGGSGGGGGGSYTAPAKPEDYQSQRSAEIDRLLDELLNRDKFSYDPTTDPVYQQYLKTYQREGQRATEDTLANVAAQAGGMNSYAVTAANQAGNYYAGKSADVIPQLYDAAYQKYLAEIDGKVRDLGILNDMDQTQYSRYRDTMSDWRDDRNFTYDMYRDQVGDQRYDREWEYQAGRDQIGDQRYEQERQDQQDKQKYDRDKETALTLAGAGNFGALAQLWGLDEEQTQALVDEYARTKRLNDGQAARDLADWYAQYGDFSRLQEQGVDTSKIWTMIGKGGSGGGGGGGKGYEPKLTASQTLSAIKEGIRSDSVLQDYEYHFGTPFEEQYSTDNAASDKAFGEFRYSLMPYRSNNGRAVQIEQAVKSKKISEAQAVELYKYFGIPLE